MKKSILTLVLSAVCLASFAADTAKVFSRKLPNWRDYDKVLAALASGEIELTGKFADDFPVLRAKWYKKQLSDADFFAMVKSDIDVKTGDRYIAAVLLRYIAREAADADIRTAARACLIEAAGDKVQGAPSVLSILYVDDADYASAFALAVEGQADRTILAHAGDKLLTAGADPREVFTGVHRGIGLGYNRMEPDDLERAVRVLCKAGAMAGASDAEIYAALVQADRVYCDKAVGDKANNSVKRWGVAIGKLRERMAKYAPVK